MGSARRTVTSRARRNAMRIARVAACNGTGSRADPRIARVPQQRPASSRSKLQPQRELRSIDRARTRRRLRAHARARQHARDGGRSRRNLDQAHPSLATGAAQHIDGERMSHTLGLAAGRTEAWIADRTGHRSTAMINRYRRAARTAAELGLGEPMPLDAAIPELRDCPAIAHEPSKPMESHAPDKICKFLCVSGLPQTHCDTVRAPHVVQVHVCGAR
jgi:hypothetical protein